MFRVSPDANSIHRIFSLDKYSPSAFLHRASFFAHLVFHSQRCAISFLSRLSSSCGSISCGRTGPSTSCRWGLSHRACRPRRTCLRRGLLRRLVARPFFSGNPGNPLVHHETIYGPSQMGRRMRAHPPRERIAPRRFELLSQGIFPTLKAHQKSRFFLLGTLHFSFFQRKKRAGSKPCILGH